MATSEQWDAYCNATGESYGKPNEITGNAKFARECRATPLEPVAILRLVWNNIEYFGDHYYEPLTTPIIWRVEEYFAQEETKANGT